MSEPLDTHGDVTGEYLALRTGCGLVTGAREIVWVRGTDAVSFLQSLLTQDLDALEPGAVRRSLLLSPQGKLRVPLWLLRGADEVGLVADAGYGEVAVDDLTRFKFRVKADIEPPEPLVELWGPGAGAVLAGAGLPAPDGWEATAGAIVARVPMGRLDRFLVHGGRREALVAAGAVPAGRLAADAVRIEAGEPVMGVDVDEKTIPQESGLVEDSVSFTKGCYLGQELVARIDSRGRVNRHLRGLVIRENVLPPLGAELTLDGKAVGTLTSLGESLELRAPVGLALVRREVEPGVAVPLRWEGGETVTEVRELPLDDFAVS